MVNQYERLEYTPPDPALLGLSAEDLAYNDTFHAVEISETREIRPPMRARLQDRLAMYTNGDSNTQKALFCCGFIFFPCWFIGTLLFFQTSEVHVESRKAGLKNVYASLVVAAACVVGLAYLAITQEHPNR